MNWWMSGLEGVQLRRGGWVLFLLDYDARYSEELREALIDSAFAAIDGTLDKSVRRSRHAETWLQRLGAAGGPSIYFKVIDASRGPRWIRRPFRGSRIAHLARISEHLRGDGIGVPEILLLGAEQRGGREVVATEKVEGRSVPRFLRMRRETLAGRRAILRALGAEVARLHRAGYLHGDLNPYNVLITGVEPPRFVFIDHDRTRRTFLSRFERPRMRNLVQLGHLDLKTITNTDRMRVWCGYSAGMATRRRRAARQRVARMLQRRIVRDRNLAQVADQVRPERREVREG